MSEQVLIRKLEHLTGSESAPRLGYAIETRASAGPVHKKGSFPDDPVSLRLHGGLVIGKARIKIAWVGEYSSVSEIRGRTVGAPIYDIADFWKGRPKAGYAAVGELAFERWVEPYWAGPRTYGYEWILLDSDKKQATWNEEKPAPKGGSELLDRFERWRKQA